MRPTYIYGGGDIRVLQVIEAHCVVTRDIGGLEDIAVSQPPQLHGRIMTGTSDRTVPSGAADRRSGTSPWEPEMGANVFSRPQTQHDATRFFSQLRRLQFD